MVKAVRLPVARPPAQNAPVAHGGVNETCLARLRSLGVEFTPVLPIAASRGCRVPAPVAISEIAPGVRLKPESRLNCQTAEALATWVRDVVLPTAVTELGSRPTALVHDSTYICRRRNNRPDGKLSKHASGNAVDIRAITFADRDTVLVRQRDGSASAEKRFQARIRRDACRYFTTVLGPGTNAAHATHFHFDLASRKGGYRLCQ
ncbi:MAG TPA: extensin family protein [Afifellaceae bacterium]|nr:extensin family protein [Afifellaceae bacterium]